MTFLGKIGPLSDERERPDFMTSSCPASDGGMALYAAPCRIVFIRSSRSLQVDAIIRKRRFYPTGFLFRYRARSRTSSTKRRPEEQSCVISLGCACLSSVSLLWPGRFQFETRSLSARCSALRLRPNNWQGAAQICPRKGTLHKSGTPGRATSSTLERFCLCSFFFRHPS